MVFMAPSLSDLPSPRARPAVRVRRAAEARRV